MNKAALHSMKLEVPELCSKIEMDARGVEQMVLNRGVFTFSLDLELAWGTRKRANAAYMEPFLTGTRDAILGLLDLFEEFNISGTWATVGALLLGNGGDSKKHPWLEHESFSDVPPGDTVTQPDWYAEDIIQAIRDCEVSQDIGSHTLTHGFVNPEKEGREQFREELIRSLQIFEEYGLGRPTSFIYPKAKMGHFDVLAELGFRSFRGPENKWFESLPGVKLPAALRLIDARLASRPSAEAPQYHPAGLWMIPSSQFYSPFYNVGKYVSIRSRVKKAIKGLHLACNNRGVFHLWTHPFNLGVKTEELLGGLREIFVEADILRKNGRLEIVSMKSLAEQGDELRASGTSRLSLSSTSQTVAPVR